MPRIRGAVEHRRGSLELIAALEDELRRDRPEGQPTIREFEFPRTGLIRVTVVWDKWHGIDDGDRVAVILQAYENVEGRQFRDRITLPIGLTVPEARGEGLLPFEVTAALRKGDAVTAEQCRDALALQGASFLNDSRQPHLYFATREEAEAAIARLAQALPGSEAVWMIVPENRGSDSSPRYENQGG
jgi:hypothetical protein